MPNNRSERTSGCSRLPGMGYCAGPGPFQPRRLLAARSSTADPLGSEARHSAVREAVLRW